MRWKTLLGTTVLAAVAVALTGCMKIGIDLTVSSDDTVDGVAILGLDQSIADLSGMSADEMREELQRDLELDQLPEGATVEPYEDDRFVGSKITFDHVPLDTFSKDASGDDLRIIHADGKYTVSGAFDLTASDLENALLKGLSAENAEMLIRITLPGEVIEHNGDLSGRTVTWHPEFGARNELIAVAEEESGMPVWIWPLLGLVALAVAAIFVMQIRRVRQAPKPAGTDAAPVADPGS